MADKAIKVAVLEGDFVSQCTLGFPLPLSLQFQQSCLRQQCGMQSLPVVAFLSAAYL